MDKHSDAQATRGLVDLADAAAFLSLSPRYLVELIRCGHIPSVRIGRRRLVRPTDLDRFIESRTVTVDGARHAEDAEAPLGAT